MQIPILDQHFTAHTTGALFWEERRMLLIADVHLGKISHFRKHGSAVPQGAVNKNFERLKTAVTHFNPESVCFLGDLFHSSINAEWELFEHWCQWLPCQEGRRQTQLILIVGNHDIIAPERYERLDIQVGSELILDGILLTHEPEEREGYFNFCGHIHPGVRLQGLGRQVLKMPCFFKKKNQLILPAFGEFTGNYLLEPEAEDEVFIVTPDEVILIE
ncbi:ligase-associated DNA damage response endonuclease PdeM [Croceiramulus getboli]|nr:ligase-associated DNA damage response endonuclease PdeM [Flavobacteriaceae bacterium YJPT1-3]